MKNLYKLLTFLILFSFIGCEEPAAENDDDQSSTPPTSDVVGTQDVPDTLSYASTGDLVTSFDGEPSTCGRSTNGSNFEVKGNNDSISISMFNYSGPGTYIFTSSQMEASVTLYPGYFVPNLSSSCSITVQTDTGSRITGSLSCTSLESGDDRANLSGTFSCSY